MANTLHRISIDVLRGIDQEDTRWAEWSEIYTNQQKFFAFWDAVTSVEPTRNDLRLLAKERTQGIRGGERPGQLPNQELAPFTTVEGEDKCEFLDPYDDRVAVLKIMKRTSEKITRTFEGLKVVGKRRDKFDQTVEVVKPIINIDGVETLLETNTFLLQSVNESFQEKFQISETFGEPVFFTFGERQKIFQYGGILFDSRSWQWKEKFLDDYERHLRGTAAIENGAIAVLITNTAITRGYILNTGIAQNEQTRGFVGFNFSLFVVDRIPLEPIERSPQDQEKAQDADPITVLFQLNNLTAKPGEVIKEFDLLGASVDLPSGFNNAGFSQTIPDPPKFWKPTANVNGVGFDLLAMFDPPAQVSYQPPDIGLNLPPGVPPEYLHEMIKADLGTKGPLRLNGTPPATENLEAGTTPDDTSTYTHAALAPVFEASNTAPSSTILYNISTGPGGQKHSKFNIEKMRTLARAGKLRVRIVRTGSPVTEGVTILVQDIRIHGEDSGYKSIQGGTVLGASSFATSWEIQLAAALTGAPWGLATLSKHDRFGMRIFEDNAFLPTPGNVSIFHIYDRFTARRVGSEVGTPSSVDSNEQHVLTDPDATFTGELQTFLDAGDKAFVRLPYPVVDEQAATFTPTTKIEVRKVLSDTKLQLGRLTKALANDPSIASRQVIGKIPLDSYKIQIERATEIKLNEAEIRKLVKNPPDGAFSNEQLNAMGTELRQPRGVVELKENRHYTE